MPKLKEVPNLIDLAISCIHHLVRNEATRVSKVIDTKFHYEAIKGTDEYDETVADQFRCDREVYLADQVEIFKDYLFSHVPFNMIEQIMDPILRGISEAVKLKRNQHTALTNNARFTRALFAIVEFCNLMVVTARRHLDLNKVPEMLRNKMFSYLPKFTNTTTLILGSGSGGLVTEAYSDKFLNGLSQMKYLVHFSLKYDCSTDILRLLSETCGKCLRVMDIERSRLVCDKSVKYIVRCDGLVKLNVFGSELSTEGHVSNIYLKTLIL